MIPKSSHHSHVLHVLFVVSRDWQVVRSERIIEILDEMNLPFRYMYVSEELWTLGNASTEALNSKRPLFALPRKGKNENPIWLEKRITDSGHEGLLEFDYKFQEFLGEERGNPRFLVFYDGYGPRIDGVPSEIFKAWLSQYDTALIFIQHGYKPRGSNAYLISLKHGIHRMLSKKKLLLINNQRSCYITFVFNAQSLVHAVLYGANPLQCKVVGNINTLAFPLLQTNKEEINRSSPPGVDGTVVFTTGSYKNANTRESKQFEMFVSHLTTLSVKKPIYIKPKSGEERMMPEDSFSLFASLGIQILHPSKGIRDCNFNSLIFSSCDSNVGLEAIHSKRPLLLFDLNSRHRTHLRKTYRRLRIPIINTETKILPAAFLDSNLSLSALFNLQKFRFELHNFIKTWLKQT